MATPLACKCSTDYLKHRENILDLPRRESGKVATALYDSLYQGNPYGDPQLGLCFDGEQLVGQENYIRQDVACAGTIYRAAQGINTLVDSRYRLFHGVFGKLCKLTIDQMRTEVDLLCAFANEESKKYYLKYFAWQKAAKVQVYKKITKYSGFNPESMLAFVRPGRMAGDLILEETAAFKAEVLDPVITRRVRDAKYAFFYKTAEYLNWRFLNSKHYKVTGYYIIYQGRICGYCLTADDGIEKKIIDILVDRDNLKIFKKTISSLARLAREHGKHRLVIYATPGCWYEKVLKRQFFIRRWDFDFIALDFNQVLPCSDWVIHMGDFDIF